MRVAICPYNDQWPIQFEREATLLQRHIPCVEKSIEHIGSTAVPSLKAKPIIDIMIGLTSMDEVRQMPLWLSSLAGYHYISHWNTVMPYRRFFIKRKQDADDAALDFEIDEEPGTQLPHTSRLIHLHVVVKDHSFYERHIRFRDILIKDKQVREQYEYLKLKLADKSWNSMSDYAAEKTTFIEETLEHNQS